MNTAPSSPSRFGGALAAAVVLHVVVLWLLAQAVSFRFVEVEEKKLEEPKIVAVAPRMVPPPPEVTNFGPMNVVTKQPRFRPRFPTVVRPLSIGDPALAIWSYLCNRDISLAFAADRACPPTQFVGIDPALREPTNRRGDVGALLGADTTTMSLEEAGAAKGWTKRKSPQGQSGVARSTDRIDAPKGPEVFEDNPELQGPSEVLPDFR